MQAVLFVLVIIKAKNTHQTTSGRWVTPVLAVHVLKSSLTMASISGAACQAHLRKMVTVSLKSGTTSLCSSTVRQMACFTRFQHLLWIPAWAWNVFLLFCNM